MVGLTLAAALTAVTTVLIVLASVYLNPDEELFFTMPWAELATVSVFVVAVNR